MEEVTDDECNTNEVDNNSEEDPNKDIHPEEDTNEEDNKEDEEDTNEVDPKEDTTEEDEEDPWEVEEEAEEDDDANEPADNLPTTALLSRLAQAPPLPLPREPLTTASAPRELD